MAYLSEFLAAGLCVYTAGRKSQGNIAKIWEYHDRIHTLRYMAWKWIVFSGVGNSSRDVFYSVSSVGRQEKKCRYSGIRKRNENGHIFCPTSYIFGSYLCLDLFPGRVAHTGTGLYQKNGDKRNSPDKFHSRI